MNINLATNYPVFADGTPESFHDQIEEHQDILKSAGFNVVGPAVLVPDPDPNYPGAYQVWNPFTDSDGRYLWAWVNPEGQCVETDFLPNAEDMEGRS